MYVYALAYAAFFGIRCTSIQSAWHAWASNALTIPHKSFISVNKHKKRKNYGNWINSERTKKWTGNNWIGNTGCETNHVHRLVASAVDRKKWNGSGFSIRILSLSHRSDEREKRFKAISRKVFTSFVAAIEMMNYSLLLELFDV